MSEPNIIPFPDPSGNAASTQPSNRSDRSTMKSDLLEQAAGVVSDIPVLINMVSQRVRQLNNGRPPLVRLNQRAGQADIALREIIEGKIVLSENGDDIEAVES